jgi:hypothetical protein
MKTSRNPPIAPRTNPAKAFSPPTQIAGAQRTRSQPPCKLQGHTEHIHDPHANCRDTVNTFTPPLQIAGAPRTQMPPPRNLQGSREQAHAPHATRIPSISVQHNPSTKGDIT